jgi:ubiquinone/menaquinone biosynthesis C-methylase UbiE
MNRLINGAGIEPNMNVADFCCGDGESTRMLARTVLPYGMVIGIDPDRDRLERGRLRCHIDGYRNVAFLHADACETGILEGWFDAVYCKSPLPRVENPSAFFGEMRKVVRPGGAIIVEENNPDAVEPLRRCLQSQGCAPEVRWLSGGGWLVLSRRAA